MAAFSVSNNTIHHKRQKSPLYAAYRFLYSGLVARFGSHPGTGSQRARFFCGCLSVSHSPLQSMKKTNTAIIDAVSVLYTHKSISLSLLITYSYYLFLLPIVWFLVVFGLIFGCFSLFPGKDKGRQNCHPCNDENTNTETGLFLLAFLGKINELTTPCGHTHFLCSFFV